MDKNHEPEWIVQNRFLVSDYNLSASCAPIFILLLFKKTYCNPFSVFWEWFRKQWVSAWNNR